MNALAVGGGDADGARGLAEAGEVVSIAVVEIAVEGLLLGEPLRGVGAGGRAHVAQHRRWLTTGLASARVDLVSRARRELGGHPVEEGPVEVASGERAHLRPHRREHEPDAGERLAQRPDRVAHRRQRPLGEAGPEPDPEAPAVEAQPLDPLVDLGRLVAIERHHRHAQLELLGALGKGRQGVEPVGPRVVVGPHGRVAERLAALGEGCRDLRVEPGGDPEATFGAHFSSRATHSTCGVCGNMSTGLTRRSV